MSRRSTFNHGDLRAALSGAAVELVAEKGVAGLSVAEATRRAGVSAAAPYRHFAHRAVLLSATATEVGRALSGELARADDEVRAGDARNDSAGLAVRTLGALATAYGRFTLARGAGSDLALADELQQYPDEERRDATRGLFDQLLRLAVAVAGGATEANPLLRGCIAVVHGHAHLARSSSESFYPTDLRGFATEGELVADEAGVAVRALATAMTVRDPGSRAV